MRRQVIISDIHGCARELYDLLDAVSPGNDDEIIAVGDLVNRGPEPGEVLRLFRDRPAARSVKGNVEHRHGRMLLGEEPTSGAYALTRRALGEQYGECVAFMETLPALIELPEALIVHGCWEPGVSKTAQRTDVLLGLAAGEARLEAQLGTPWYEHYDGPKPLIVGHHDYGRTRTPLIREGRVYAIDTGCVHGGQLTALVLPEFRIVSIPAREDYWAPDPNKLGN